MIHCVTGKPGAGKGLSLVSFVLDEVLAEKDTDGKFRNRRVLTNLPFKVAECSAYMRQHYPEWHAQVDFSEQLIVFGVDEEADFFPEFWRYRGPCKRPADWIEGERYRDDFSKDFLRKLPEEDWVTVGIDEPLHDSITKKDYEREENPKRPCWHLNDGGSVVYVLDELHKFLGARQWAKNPPVILDYNSQHRHFGDDVYWATQEPSLVDKQLKAVTADYWYVRNMEDERIGWFKKGRGFHVEIFQSEDFNVVPDRKLNFQFNPEHGACYKTSIIGGAADTSKRRKGLPKWMFYALVGILLAVFLLVFVKGPGLIFGFGGDDDESPPGSPLEQSPMPAAPRPSWNPPVTQPSSPALSAAGDSQREYSTAVNLANLLPSDLVRMLERRPPELGSSNRESVGGNLTGVQMTPIDASSQLLLRGDKQLVQEFALIVAQIDRKARVESVTLRGVLAAVDITDSEGSALEVVYRAVEAATGVPIRLDTAAAAIGGDGGAVTIRASGLDSIVSVLARSNRFMVVSRPYLTGVTGVPLILSSGREIPIRTLQTSQVGATETTTFRPVELRLEVLSVIRPDGKYRLTIRQTNSDVLAGTGGDGVPSLSSQSLETTVIAGPGDLVALGGLAVDTYIDQASGLPVLVRKPLSRRLGDAARESSRRELVVLLVVDSGNQRQPVNTVVPALDPPEPSYSPRRANERPDGLPARRERRGLLERLRSR